MGKGLAITVPVGINPAALAILVGIPVIVTAVLIAVLYPAIGARIVVSNDTISIGPSLFCGGLKFSKGDVREVEIVNLSERSDLRPTLRVCGAAAFGYLYGWFKLSNGHKAFLAIYRYGGRAVVVVLKDGTYVIMSPRNLDRLLEVLKGYGWVK